MRRRWPGEWHACMATVPAATPSAPGAFPACAPDDQPAAATCPPHPGLRFIYATGPYVLYILGPTSLLIATVLCVAAQVLFDIVPAYSVEEEEEGEEDDGEQAAASGAVKQEHAALQVAPSPS